MRSIKLTVPFTPISLNCWQRQHWGARRRVKEDCDSEIIVAMIKETGFTILVPLMEKAKVSIRYYFRTKHKRDKDNYTPKVIMDCLKGRVFVDDSSDRVDVNWELLYDKNRPRTEIMIEETGG